MTSDGLMLQVDFESFKRKATWANSAEVADILARNLSPQKLWIPALKALESKYMLPEQRVAYRLSGLDRGKTKGFNRMLRVFWKRDLPFNIDVRNNPNISADLMPSGLTGTLAVQQALNGEGRSATFAHSFSGRRDRRVPRRFRKSPRSLGKTYEEPGVGRFQILSNDGDRQLIVSYNAQNKNTIVRQHGWRAKAAMKFDRSGIFNFLTNQRLDRVIDILNRPGRS